MDPSENLTLLQQQITQLFWNNKTDAELIWHLAKQAFVLGQRSDPEFELDQSMKLFR